MHRWTAMSIERSQCTSSVNPMLWSWKGESEWRRAALRGRRPCVSQSRSDLEGRTQTVRSPYWDSRPSCTKVPLFWRGAVRWGEDTTGRLHFLPPLAASSSYLVAVPGWRHRRDSTLPGSFGCFHRRKPTSTCGRGATTSHIDIGDLCECTSALISPLPNCQDPRGLSEREAAFIWWQKTRFFCCSWH